MLKLTKSKAGLTRRKGLLYFMSFCFVFFLKNCVGRLKAKLTEIDSPKVGMYRNFLACNGAQTHEHAVSFIHSMPLLLLLQHLFKCLSDIKNYSAYQQLTKGEKLKKEGRTSGV